MDLSVAASYFDETPVADGVTGAFLFHGQLDLFDDNRRDSLTTARRVLSLDPALLASIPAHRLLTVAGQRWCVGMAHADSFQGEAIRQKVVLHLADSDVQYGHGRAFVAPTEETPTSAAGGMLWVKTASLATQDNDSRSEYTLFLPKGTPITPDHYALVGGVYYVVLEVHAAEGGFVAAQLLSILGAGLQTVAYAAKGAGFDLVSGRPGASAPVNVAALVMTERDQYRYLTEASERLRRGDVQLVIARSALSAVASGDTVVMNNRTYTVSDVTPQGDMTWLLTARA